MAKITILYEYPAILTKDASWPEKEPRIEPGSIVILPQDAVLVLPPEKVEIKGEPIVFKQEEIDGAEA